MSLGNLFIHNKTFKLMRKFLLSLVVAFATVFAANAQTWEWGTATWNIEDGKVYDGIKEFQADSLALTFPNPTNFTLTYFHGIYVSYNLYIDDATEPVLTHASAQMSAKVLFDYNYVEGHKYRIETTEAILTFANIAIYQTDTLSLNDTDSYSISFTINGPELVKTYEVEGTQAVTITDQDWDLTYSLVDVQGIASALGIDDLSQAEVHALNPNGSYNDYAGSDWYDGWRDADGDYTLWWGGWDKVAGHNAYPAVYSIKLSENADSVYYYFYDYWATYVPDQPDSIGGSGIGGTVEAARRAPVTSYNDSIWPWYDEENDTTYLYNRRWRCDEGKDYKASFAFVANKKMVQLNATLHFVSEEAYKDYITAIEEAPAVPANNSVPTGIYGLNGEPRATLQKGINIVKDAEGNVKKVYVK